MLNGHELALLFVRYIFQWGVLIESSWLRKLEKIHHMAEFHWWMKI